MQIVPFRCKTCFVRKNRVLSWTLLCFIVLLVSSIVLFIELNRSFLNLPSAEKLNRPKIFLLIVIISCGKNYERREAIRNTWLQFSPQESKYIFIIGGKNFKYNRLQIEKEITEFEDIVFLPDIDDTYEFLSSKILNTLIHVSENWNFQFLLKCDDDSFVQINSVVSELMNKYSHINNLYWGYFHGSAVVKKIGRWKENKWVLCDRYLPYALGGGYILSASLVRFIASNHEYLVLFQPEDVTVGTWLAAVNVTRVHDSRFDTEYSSRGCSNTYLITHKHNPKNMKQFYSNIKKTGKLCSAEFKLRLSYVYNWKVPPSKCCIRNNSSIP